MGPRPFDPGNLPVKPDIYRIDVIGLQRGRDLSIAETLPSRALLVAHLHASMGPRPFDRGNVLTTDSGAQLLLPLQWGRDLSIAETSVQEFAEKAYGLLQWGRDLSIAETSERMQEDIANQPSLQWGRDLSIAET